MKKFNFFLDTVMRFIMAAAMFALLAGGTWQIFTRWILKNPSTFTDEFLRYVPVSYTHLSGKTSTGERWNNAIRLKGKGSYVKYAANGQYRLLSGVIAPSSQFSSGIMAKVTVYGDNDTVLYTSQDIHYNEKLIHFGVDVTGQNAIRVEVSLVTDNEWDDPIILMDGLSLYK